MEQWRRYIKEQSQTINIDEEGGNVFGVVHSDMQTLENWADKERIDRPLIDDLSPPVAVLKNINVEEEARNRGIGASLLKRFLDETGDMPVLLISDDSETNAFSLTDWYGDYGFETIGKAGGLPVMLKDESRMQSLDEGAIDDALKKLPRGVPEETWKEYLILMRELDPSGKSKYVRWAAAELRPIMVPHGQPERPDESADNINMEKITRFMDTVKKYDELLPHVKASEKHKEFADISKVKNISKLRSLVWDMEDIAKLKAVQKKTKKKKSEIAEMESEVLDREPRDKEEYEGNRSKRRFILRRPFTTHASCHYGTGSKWCVSGENDNQFLNYNNENIALYFLDNLKLPEKHRFRMVAFSVMYDRYDTDETEVDMSYDAEDKALTLDQLKELLKDYIPPERIDEMVKKMVEHTNKYPPIEDGVGSDIGEPFKGKAEWEPKLSSWEDVMGTDLKVVGDDEEVEEGRDYQRESERIKQHSKRKKELVGVSGRSKGAPPGA